MISGTREQIYRATERITELVQRSAQAGGGVDTFYMHVPANKVRPALCLIVVLWSLIVVLWSMVCGTLA